MAFRDLKPWRRSEYADISNLPIKAINYTDIIYKNSDPTHPDPNIQDEMIILDQNTGTQLRSQGVQFDPEGSANAQYDPTSTRTSHLSAMQHAVRNIFMPWEGSGSKSPGTAGMLCSKCGELLDTNQREIIEDPASPTGYNYRHAQFGYGGCRRSKERTWFGAKRRPLRGQKS